MSVVYCWVHDKFYFYLRFMTNLNRTKTATLSEPTCLPEGRELRFDPCIIRVHAKTQDYFFREQYYIIGVFKV